MHKVLKGKIKADYFFVLSAEINYLISVFTEERAIAGLLNYYTNIIKVNLN